MAGRGGAKSGGKSPGSVSVSGSKGLVGLFPAEDSDEEVVVTPTTARKASPSPAAQADWSLFPGKEEDFGQTAAPEAPAGGKKSEKHPKSGIARLLSQSPRPGSNPASPNMTRGGDYVFPSPGSDKRKKKSKSTSNEKNPDQDNKHDSHKKHGHEYQQSNKGASPLHAGIHDEGGEYNDLEAARPSPLSRSAVPVGMEASEAASDDFEVSGQVKPNCVYGIPGICCTPYYSAAVSGFEYPGVRLKSPLIFKAASFTLLLYSLYAYVHVCACFCVS